MIGIVIVAHGGLAREYLAAIEHVVGAQQGIRAISIEADHDRRDKQMEICAAADEVDHGPGRGGCHRPFRRITVEPEPACLSPENRRILYGANLPMLIKARQKPPELDVPDAVRAALDAGKKYIDSQNISAE